MRSVAVQYAERGVQLLETTLRSAPPRGVPVEFVGSFFAKFRSFLRGELAKILDQILDSRGRETRPTPVDVLPPEGMPPDEWPAPARTAANVAAIRLLASGSPIGPADRTTLLRYSGWGGLSIDAVAAQLPVGWVPEVRGLIHEYYTATKIAREIARVLLPLVLTLPSQDGVVQALEPAAGIGRLVNAFSGPGFEALSFTAVEFSRVSARLLAAARPDIKVFEGPFERWLAQSEAEVSGKLGLVVSNPPYGARGGSVTEDANKAYREHKAYRLDL